MNKKTAQAEIQRLQNEASAAKADTEYYRTLANSRQITLQDMGQRHQEQLKKLTDQAVYALQRQAELNELTVVRAERDSIGKAFQYIVDNLTTHKAQ